MRTLLLAAAVSTALAVPAFAEQVKVGELTCEVSAGLGAIIASSKDMTCRYAPFRGRHEVYHGHIGKFGLDVGATDRGVLAWGVFAPSARLPRHALAGGYSGFGANATVGVGLGAASMMGGMGHEISLQPSTVQTPNGLDFAAGVTSMSLRPGH
ncbi:MAG TPA: DUF992 domain-containing protein [Roseiarcus sp.]|nr:DUF992 domain-containing protein [Roseiarcus sp.]